MRLHLIAFPHTRVTPEFCGCAYTAKILKFCKMMGDRYDIVLYAPEGSDPADGELVQVLSDDERIGIFGPDDANRLPAWPTDEQNALFIARTITELAKRLEPGDLTLLAMGYSQRQIVQAFPNYQCIEPGVGYEGVLPGWRAFESYAWMHYIYAKQQHDDIRNYDRVIPNYFDPDEFPDTNSGDGDYLLFVGRLIQRKAPHIAALIAERLGMPLLVVGAGAVTHEPGKIVAPEVTIEGAGVEYVGPVGIEERSRLMAGAAAVLTPTLYLEPFGGVAVEAMMCGTPVVASDFGAFTETVQEGVSGYRFRTLAGGCEAVELAVRLDNDRVRDYALERYSLEAVAPLFDRWFRDIDSLNRDGWYEPYISPWAAA